MNILKKKLGRKSKTVDNSGLSTHNKQAWDLQQQQQLKQQQSLQHQRRLEQDHSPYSTPSKGKASRQAVHAQAQTSAPQADWFTAAMQNSAQLTDMAAAPPQEKLQEKASSSCKTPKLTSKHKGSTRESQFEEPNSPQEVADRNSDWFEQAIQQSSQLSQMGGR